jgi:hypothetical protein
MNIPAVIGMAFGRSNEQSAASPAAPAPQRHRFKRANWLSGGVLTILTSATNFILYLTTGKGLTSRTGHAMEGGAAVALSLVMLVVGLIFIYLHFRRARKESSRTTTSQHR